MHRPARTNAGMIKKCLRSQTHTHDTAWPPRRSTRAQAVSRSAKRVVQPEGAPGRSCRAARAGASRSSRVRPAPAQRADWPQQGSHEVRACAHRVATAPERTEGKLQHFPAMLAPSTRGRQGPERWHTLGCDPASRTNREHAAQGSACAGKPGAGRRVPGPAVVSRSGRQRRACANQERACTPSAQAHAYGTRCWNAVAVSHIGSASSAPQVSPATGSSAV